MQDEQKNLSLGITIKQTPFRKTGHRLKDVLSTTSNKINKRNEDQPHAGESKRPIAERTPNS